MALEVMKLFFVVLDASFNSGHCTVIIKRQFLFINLYERKERAYGASEKGDFLNYISKKNTIYLD